MRLNFTSDVFAPEVNCTVEAVDGSPYTISGTGRYAAASEEFGGQKRDAIYLTYTVNDGTYTYTATDVVVYRNRNVNFETYTPVVKH
jgi:arginyl-tRNA synthetase